MPADAYMELSDPAVWGETHDEEFGMGPKGRQLGAFEISKFDFNVSSNREDADDSDSRSKPVGQAASGKAAASVSQPTIGSFTISKYVDKASPDLFLSCLQKTCIDWAIITIRETGEHNRKPYLVLEFTKVYVDDFTWGLNPGDPEGAASEETVKFSFGTILIKYSRQETTGLHPVVKMKGWNRLLHNASVTELQRHSGAMEQVR
jgi:type VI protein secretion system component Hcp